MTIKKGSFVRIEKIILQADERTSKIPKDTKATPFKMWTKGFLQEDCVMNEKATIKTKANRIDSGKLVEVNPMYELNYGEYLPEMTEIDVILKDERYGE
jgi:hypothetical protein